MLVWVVFISTAAVIITIWDKTAARQKKRRVSENTLMLVGLFGGAAAMLITMKKIRHKTLHKKFMIGLPLEILLQLLFVFGLFYLYMICA